MRKDKKIFPYVVIIRQKNRRRVELLGIITILIFILLLVQRMYEYPTSRIYNLLVLISVSGMLAYQLRHFMSHKKVVTRPLYIVAFLALLLIPPFSWFAILFVIMAILEKFALTPEEIGFSHDEIVFNGLLPKKISWTELNNVILKDGIITIDFKNDRLIQKETDDEEDEDEDASEEEFNEYCAERLRIANYGLRITD
jgi:hypothetical protein